MTALLEEGRIYLLAIDIEGQKDVIGIYVGEMRAQNSG